MAKCHQKVLLLNFLFKVLPGFVLACVHDSKIALVPVEKIVRNLPMVLVLAFYTNNNLPRLDNKWAKHQVWMFLGSGPILCCKTTILRMRPAGLLNTLTKESRNWSGPFFLWFGTTDVCGSKAPAKKKIWFVWGPDPILDWSAPYFSVV